MEVVEEVEEEEEEEEEIGRPGRERSVTPVGGEADNIAFSKDSEFEEVDDKLERIVSSFCFAKNPTIQRT